MKKIFKIFTAVSFFCFTLVIQAQAACRDTTKVCIENPATGFFVTAPGTTFPQIIKFAIENVLLPLVGLVAVAFIIIGGFQYITSHGNEEQAEAGKKTLTNAIIGLVVVILSYVIVVVIINALNNKV